LSARAALCVLLLLIIAPACTCGEMASDASGLIVLDDPAYESQYVDLQLGQGRLCIVAPSVAPRVVFRVADPGSVRTLVQARASGPDDSVIWRAGVVRGRVNGVPSAVKLIGSPEAIYDTSARAFYLVLPSVVTPIVPSYLVGFSLQSAPQMIYWSGAGVQIAQLGSDVGSLFEMRTTGWVARDYNVMAGSPLQITAVGQPDSPEFMDGSTVRDKPYHITFQGKLDSLVPRWFGTQVMRFRSDVTGSFRIPTSTISTAKLDKKAQILMKYDLLLDPDDALKKGTKLWRLEWKLSPDMVNQFVGLAYGHKWYASTRAVSTGSVRPYDDLDQVPEITVLVEATQYLRQYHEDWSEVRKRGYYALRADAVAAKTPLKFLNYLPAVGPPYLTLTAHGWYVNRRLENAGGQWIGYVAAGLALPAGGDKFFKVEYVSGEDPLDGFRKRKGGMAYSLATTF